jgi:hypothetical protein
MSFRDKLRGRMPIPSWLHSVQHDMPFLFCTVCDGRLATRGLFTIMKSYRGEECVFEMAICARCSGAEMEKWSTASRKAARAFRETRIQFEGCDGCQTCGADLEAVRGMAVHAHCRSDQMLAVSHMCTSCEEALHQCLSPKTREENDRFMKTHFPQPPWMYESPCPEPVQVAGPPLS